MPPEEAEMRIVETSDINFRADGRPHGRNAGEIEEIQLLKTENKGKNQRRM